MFLRQFWIKRSSKLVHESSEVAINGSLQQRVHHVMPQSHIIITLKGLEIKSNDYYGVLLLLIICTFLHIYIATNFCVRARPTHETF